MGKKNLLESPNFIGPNWPNSDSKQVISRGCEASITILQTRLSQCTFWGKSPVRHRMMSLCSGLISMMRPDVFFAGEVMVKPKALNSPPPLFLLALPAK